MHLSPGNRVRLVVPENARLHGAPAVVESVEPWGAFVRTEAAATGRFRAASAEMVVMDTNGAGYTGDCCAVCGSSRMVRTGACATCQECGTSGGCA